DHGSATRLHLPGVAAVYDHLPTPLVHGEQLLLSGGPQDAPVQPGERHCLYAISCEDLYQLLRNHPAHHHHEDVHGLSVGIPTADAFWGDYELLFLAQLGGHLGHDVSASVDQDQLVGRAELPHVREQVG